MNPAAILYVALLGAIIVILVIGLLYWESRQVNHNKEKILAHYRKDGNFWLNPAGDSHED